MEDTHMTQNMTRIALATCLVALAGTASAQVRPAPQPGPIAVQPIRPPEVKPLIREKAEQPLDVKMAVVPLALRDQVDPRKYGFTDMEAMKVSTRKALGLPQGFP